MARSETSGSTWRLVGYVALMEAVVATAVVVTLLVFFAFVFATGAAQPWGAINDASSLPFFALVACLALLTRRIPSLSEGRGSRAVISAGALASVTGVAGGGFLVWEEFGGPTFGAMRLFMGLGLGLQTVATILLIGWCVSFGYELKQQGWPNALRWGIVGATFLGAPAWFAWLGRRFLASPED